MDNLATIGSHGGKAVLIASHYFQAVQSIVDYRSWNFAEAIAW